MAPDPLVTLSVGACAFYLLGVMLIMYAGI